MKNYIFRTTATMKEYNRCKWWIDSDIVTEKRIKAETVADALEIWREQVEEQNYISISKEPLNNWHTAKRVDDQGHKMAKKQGYFATFSVFFARFTRNWA